MGVHGPSWLLHRLPHGPGERQGPQLGLQPRGHVEQDLVRARHLARSQGGVRLQGQGTLGIGYEDLVLMNFVCNSKLPTFSVGSLDANIFSTCLAVVANMCASKK